MQDMTLDDGRRYREFFAQKEDETPDQFQERMQKKAQKKLRNPEVNKFYQELLDMSVKDAQDYASTSEKGLPKKRRKKHG